MGFQLPHLAFVKPLLMAFSLVLFFSLFLRRIYLQAGVVGWVERVPDRMVVRAFWGRKYNFWLYDIFVYVKGTSMYDYLFTF